SPCSAEIMVCVEETLFFRRTCGMASAWIKALIRAVVSSPLERPSSEMPMLVFPSRSSGGAVRRFCTVRGGQRPARTLPPATHRVRNFLTHAPGGLAQEAQDALAGLVRLGQHGSAGLGEDVRL